MNVSHMKNLKIKKGFGNCQCLPGEFVGVYNYPQSEILKLIIGRRSENGEKYRSNTK